jgi:hypothetical protein
VVSLKNRFRPSFEFGAGDSDMPKLKSRKRETFAIEVAAMTPLDRAYVLAGYRDSPWARYNASKLAHVLEVAERVAELQAEFADRSGIHLEYLQRKLLPVVEANPQDLFEAVDDGNGGKRDKLRPVSAMRRDLAAAIQKIKIDPETGAVTDVTFWNKIEAGSVLLRSVGGLIDRLEVTDPEKKSSDEMLDEIVRPIARALGIADAELGDLKEKLRKGFSCEYGPPAYRAPSRAAGK